MAELRLECAKFELGRINDLINRKSFVKRVQKDMDKLSRAMRRQRRAETKVDEYESLILDIKSKLEAKKQEKAQKAAAS